MQTAHVCVGGEPVRRLVTEALNPVSSPEDSTVKPSRLSPGHLQLSPGPAQLLPHCAPVPGQCRRRALACWKSAPAFPDTDNTSPSLHSFHTLLKCLFLHRPGHSTELRKCPSPRGSYMPASLQPPSCSHLRPLCLLALGPQPLPMCPCCDPSG